jgi:hypothetical protein
MRPLCFAADCSITVGSAWVRASSSSRCMGAQSGDRAPWRQAKQFMSCYHFHWNGASADNRCQTAPLISRRHGSAPCEPRRPSEVPSVFRLPMARHYAASSLPC